MILRLLFLLLLIPSCAGAEDFPGLSRFMDEMAEKHHFDRDELAQTFRHVQRRQAVIDAISRPATLKPWPEYRDGFVNPQRVSGGLAFWQTYADALQRAERQYGVPQEVIVALIGVETRYGLNAGKFSTLDALATLAFDYPRRGAYFRSELEQYLLLVREQGLDIGAVQGSYAGALGIPQFMPGSYRKYAVDFDGDGKADLLHDPVDAIGSVANYLQQYGWSRDGAVALRGKLADAVYAGSVASGARPLSAWAAAGIVPAAPSPENGPARLVDFTVPDGKEFWLAFGNFDVITKYNNSDYYAMTVFLLAQALKEAHGAANSGAVAGQ